MRLDDPIFKHVAGELKPWTILSETTISSDATVDISLVPGYKRYVFILRGIVPASDATTLLMRISFDGGSTFNTEAKYRCTGIVATTAVAARGTITSGFQLSGNSETLGTNTGEDFHSTVYLNSIGDGVGYPSITFKSSWRNSAAATTHLVSNGQWIDTTGYNAVTDVRFLMSSGNIASGHITVLGRET